MPTQIGPPITTTAGQGTFSSRAVPAVEGTPDNVEINYADSGFITGRLLTLIDATFTDPAQRKAQKDLVKREIRDWMADLYDCKNRGIAHSRSVYTD